MTLAKIAELFTNGYSDTAIADLLIEVGYADSFHNTRKSIGFLRKLLESGNSAEAMLLTKQKLDKNGNVISQTYSRRSLQDETIPDHLQIDALTTAPGGGQWRKYKSYFDSGPILREELIKAVQPLKIDYSEKAQTGDLALEIMICDHHFGKIPFSYKVED